MKAALLTLLILSSFQTFAQTNQEKVKSFFDNLSRTT